MKLLVTVHNYAGTGKDYKAELIMSSALYARGLQSAGYIGDAWAVADALDAGEVVFIEQFQITVQKEDCNHD